jgi:hypothetical protein
MQDGYGELQYTVFAVPELPTVIETTLGDTEKTGIIVVQLSRSSGQSIQGG